jgi:transposase-like protein
MITSGGLKGAVALLVRGGRETGLLTPSGSVSTLAGFRFPPGVIVTAMRWYLRCGLSYRDVEELFAGRGGVVHQVTIYRGLQMLTPEFVEAGLGRLKRRLRPMRGLKSFRSARDLAAGHAFAQIPRRGPEIAVDQAAGDRLRAAFDESMPAV